MHKINHFQVILKRMKTLGLSPKDARSFAFLVSNLIKTRGEQGAIEYLKSVGVALINYVSGDTKPTPWVKIRYGFPAVINYLRGYPDEVLLRVAKVARYIILDDVTPEQALKLVRAAHDPYSGSPEAIEELNSLVVEGIRFYTNLSIPKKLTLPGTVVAEYNRFSSVSGPVPNALSTPPVREALEFVLSHKFLTDLPAWKHAFAPIHPVWLDRKVLASNRYGVNTSPYVGAVFQKQEGGGKCRMYAAPFTVLQNLLTPLHDYVKFVRDQLPTDCTMDQEAGAIWAQRLLQKGVTLSSVDMSTFTCRYPLVSQLFMLRILGVPEVYVEAFEQVSRGTWEVNKPLQPFFGETFQWACGQPLGTIPSISTAGTHHNFLCTGICVRKGRVPKNTFRILGDDIIWADQECEVEYRRVLSAVCVEVSEHKSYVSNRYAEFAGFSITPTLTHRPGRWRVPEDIRVLELSRDLGPEFIHELSQTRQEALRLTHFTLLKDDLPYEDLPHLERTLLREDDWGLYLQYASALRGGVQYFRTLPSSTTWYEGACNLLHRELPGCWVLPDTQVSFTSLVAKSLPPELGKYIYQFSDSGMECVLSVACSLITNNAYNAKDALLMLDSLENSMRPYFWLPPVGKQRNKETNLFRKGIRVIRRVNDNKKLFITDRIMDPMLGVD